MSAFETQYWAHAASPRIAEYVCGILEPMRCHDWDHTQRVLCNCRELIKRENAQQYEVIIELAALLHDIARPDEMRAQGACCHACVGAARVPEILARFEVDPALHAPVARCVLTHRYRSSNPPETLPEKILFDADKLDALGAIGIARAFYFSGRVGARLHNPQNEALSAPELSNEDTAYREYLVKLRYLPGKMTTESGRALAENRLRFTSSFFDILNLETYGILPV